MAIKNAVGRPQEFSMKTVRRLEDLIAHNYSISDACSIARISKSTYYYYLKREPLFAEAMAQAHQNQRKVSFNFRTIP
jgi:ACT domain-containing protein